MTFEHFERGYLLPKGCKDLIDVIRLQPRPLEKIFLKPLLVHPKPQKGTSLEPPSLSTGKKGDIFVSDHTTVKELAALLGLNPIQIIADAIQLGLFATLSQALGFTAVSKIAEKYGYSAKRVA